MRHFIGIFPKVIGIFPKVSCCTKPAKARPVDRASNGFGTAAEFADTNNRALAGAQFCVMSWRATRWRRVAFLSSLRSPIADEVPIATKSGTVGTRSPGVLVFQAVIAAVVFISTGHRQIVLTLVGRPVIMSRYRGSA